jgi:ABC-type molybdenum transport system ATPase subunit/photorepair protein PhrA
MFNWLTSLIRRKKPKQVKLENLSKSQYKIMLIAKKIVNRKKKGPGKE